MKYVLRAICVVLLLSCSALSFGAIAVQQLLPSWPQAFNLETADHATFGIPVTRTGDIAVNVKWEGCPVGIQLKDFAGKIVTSAKPMSAPASALAYHVTEADLARGPVWAICVTTQGGVETAVRPDTSRTAAKGTVSATYPAVDVTKLQTALSAFQARQQAALSAAQRLGGTPSRTISSPTGTGQVVFAEPNRAARIASQTAALKSRFDALSRVSSLASTLGTAPRLADLKPAIYSIVPGNGYPGDAVKITATCVEPDVNNYIFRFVFDKYPSVSAKPTVAVQNADSTVAFTVTLPPLPTQTSEGLVTSTQVELVQTNISPAYTSPRKPFRLDYVPTPAITSVTPGDLGTETHVVVKGAHIITGASLHFIMPDGSDKPAVWAVVDAANSQISGDIPDYHSTEKGTLKAYVQNREGKASAAVPITAGPTGFVLTGADRSGAEPGEAVLITGKGFRSPVVWFNADENPGVTFDRQYLESRWEILSKSETAILAKVPDSFGGYAYPLAGRIKVSDYAVTTSTGQRSADSGKTATTTTSITNVIYPFTLKVTKVQIALCPAPFKDDKCARGTQFDAFGSSCTKNAQGEWQWVYGMHEGSALWGFSGYDTVYLGMPLWNDWKVVDAKIWDKSGNGAGARIDSFGDANAQVSSPYVKVRWYADWGCSSCFYYVTLYIKGPKGTEWRNPAFEFLR